MDSSEVNCLNVARLSLSARAHLNTAAGQLRNLHRAEPTQRLLPTRSILNQADAYLLCRRVDTVLCRLQPALAVRNLAVGGPYLLLQLARKFNGALLSALDLGIQPVLSPSPLRKPIGILTSTPHSMWVVTLDRLIQRIAERTSRRREGRKAGNVDKLR